VKAVVGDERHKLSRGMRREASSASVSDGTSKIMMRVDTYSAKAGTRSVQGELDCVFGASVTNTNELCVCAT
jgi:hypothetical protein